MVLPPPDPKKEAYGSGKMIEWLKKPSPSYQVFTHYSTKYCVRINGEQHFHVPELIFDKTVTSNNYDEWAGANLVNIYLSEFTIETADGKRKNMRYKQVFTNNTGKKSEITKCHRGENWTMVSFKPDFKIFGMECLEDDTVALLKRRVVDLAGCLGKGVKVELDGKRVPPKTFEDYVKLYLPTSMRVFEKINNRWEVSFVNNIATMKGGSHVDYITSPVTMR
ncbi:DNA topoisomerase 2 isoform X2 [Tanacetum coccineum]